MTNKTLTAFCLLIILGCNNYKQRSCDPYFSFDEIEHYYINIEESAVWDILGKEKIAENEKIQFDLLVGSTLQKLSDTTLLENIEKLDFKKTELPVTKFSQVNEIFCEKKHKEVLSTTCEAVYRDILVFKKENKIIGTAKICFGCIKSIIAGTRANTDEFGQSGDYDELFKLLH
ncbi:MAG: hypothetical protein ABIO79_06800 [Ferruginibacter sp.]